MRLNNAHKYLHIAIPRTASSSVSYYLSTEANPEPDDHHMPLSRALELYPCANDYFKFTFVRHPLDRLVSLYHEFRFNRVYEYSATVRVEEPLLSEFTDFNDFCLRLPHDKWAHNIFFKPQTYFTHIWDLNGMDFVGRFENLYQDLTKVSQILKLSPKPLKKIRPSTHKHYMTYYNKESIDSIVNFYDVDFKEFDYEV